MTAREYLPMGIAILFWAVVALAAGHADAARLLSATVLLRAVLMLVQLATIGPLRLRRAAPPAVQSKSRRRAWLMQLAAFGLAVLLVGLLTFGLRQAGQSTLGNLLPLLALGFPARAYRAVTPQTSSEYFRLFNAGSALAGALVAWALGAGIVGMALAYAGREWISTAAMRLWPHERPAPTRPIDEPLRFAEVARNTVITSRRLLTYRLTKNLLAVFGPFGNFAARTGRGMGWHSKLEPYMPHRLSGFLLFALLTGGAAVLLAIHSGEPAAMVAGAGLMQLCAIALNVLILWRYLPRRDDPNVLVEEDEDE